MRRTEQEAIRMGRLVDDMLLLAKLDEERPLYTHDVDVGVLVRDAADARAAWPERAIEVDVPTEEVHVNGDEDRRRQVRANIVGNALVHTDAAMKIALRARRRDGDVRIEVEDRGTGMPPEIAERVTERFFRADPVRSRHRGGSGLGLSIVDATVRAHGGTVTIDSAPGVGTTVRLAIPATAPPA
jgi:two-component system, OmpR family, sensor kinase